MEVQQTPKDSRDASYPLGTTHTVTFNDAGCTSFTGTKPATASKSRTVPASKIAAPTATGGSSSDSGYRLVRLARPRPELRGALAVGTASRCALSVELGRN